MLLSATLLGAPEEASGAGGASDAPVPPDAGGLAPRALVLTPKVSPKRAVNLRLLLVSASSATL